ncbi:HORMA domain-containing protein [Entamoeba marina]
MTTQIQTKFIQDFISTVLCHCNVYPQYCFERCNGYSTSFYRSLSPILNEYLQELVKNIPLTNAIRIEIFQLPYMQVVMELFLLFPLNEKGFPLALNAIQRIERNHADANTYTFQISVISSQIKNEWVSQETTFFGDKTSLQPLTNETCIVLLRKH